MATRTISIQRTSYLFLILVICIMTVASATGIWVLQKNYRNAEFRFESEAKLTLRHAAVTVQNQIAFYSGILKTLANNPRLFDLLEFGDTGEVVQWSQNIASELPGTLGTALARPDGSVIGDQQLQRIGHVCENDIRHFAASRFVPYPPVHKDIPGLEHFDLFERLKGASGEVSGVLFISFRLEALGDLLKDILTGEQRYRLMQADGRVIAEASALQQADSTDATLELFEAAIPGTDWRLTLEVPYENPLNFYSAMVLTDLAALGVIAILVLWVTRHLLNLFNKDIQRIHTALQEAGRGNFKPSEQGPAIRETEYLLADIEALVERLRSEKHPSDQDDVTDPLTGLYNRRYFDLLLSHSYEQSKRQLPAHLVVIVLNDFQRTIESLGRPRGDEILCTVAKHLRAHSRASDTLTRIDDDRFGLILHNMAGTVVDGWVQQLADDYDAKITDSAPPICSDGACRLSLGVTLVDAQLYDHPVHALESADEAARQAAQSDTLSDRSRVAIVGTPEPLARVESS